MVTSALNQGRGIINYCGHGSQNAWTSSGFTSSHVAALTNDHMLPFIFSVACVNGLFAGGNCFAEAWLRATHNGNPSGAVAAYMASINQSWNPPMAAQDEADDILVQDRARTYGSLCFNGSCLMMDQYGQDGSDMFMTWHIFGDPSLRVRTAAPVAIAATHDGVIAPDATSFPVATDCPDALCALSYNGTLLGTAVADHAGRRRHPGHRRPARRAGHHPDRNRLQPDPLRRAHHGPAADHAVLVLDPDLVRGNSPAGPDRQRHPAHQQHGPCRVDPELQPDLQLALA